MVAAENVVIFNGSPNIKALPDAFLDILHVFIGNKIIHGCTHDVGLVGTDIVIPSIQFIFRQ